MITIQPINKSPNLIGLWYLNMVHSGRADQVFYSFPHNLKFALDWAMNTTAFYGAFRGDELIGAGWVDNVLAIGGDPPATKAELGFGFMPNCGIFEALQAGRLMLDYSFDVYGIDFLFGTTPLSNKAALAYAKRLGLRLYEPVENFCTYQGKIDACVTSSISKEVWHERRSKRETGELPQDSA